MDFNDLFTRLPLTGRPLAVLVRPRSAEERTSAAIDAVRAMLSGRPAGDEVWLIAGEGDDFDLPARSSGVRWRLVRDAEPHSGRALHEVLEACQRDIVILVTPDVRLDASDLARGLDRLDQADIVAGNRSSRSWWTWLRPWEGLLRRWLGVPLSDPLGPVKWLRKSALAGVELQSSGPMVEIELFAKASYLYRLVDEVPIDGTRDGGVGSAFWESGASGWSWVLSPRFGSIQAPLPTEPSAPAQREVFSRHESSRRPRTEATFPRRSQRIAYSDRWLGR